MSLLNAYILQTLLFLNKIRFLPTLFILTVSLALYSFNQVEYANIKISIAGVDHELSAGLKISEFGKMTVVSLKEGVEIASLEITLARGARAISKSAVEGNTFELSQLKANARSGDMIVVDIKSKYSDDKLPSPDNSIIVFKVN